MAEPDDGWTCGEREAAEREERLLMRFAQLSAEDIRELALGQMRWLDTQWVDDDD